MSERSRTVTVAQSTAYRRHASVRLTAIFRLEQTVIIAAGQHRFVSSVHTASTTIRRVRPRNIHKMAHRICCDLRWNRQITDATGTSRCGGLIAGLTLSKFSIVLWSKVHPKLLSSETRPCSIMHRFPSFDTCYLELTS